VNPFGTSVRDHRDDVPRVGFWKSGSPDDPRRPIVAEQLEKLVRPRIAAVGHHQSAIRPDLIISARKSSSKSSA
jgi:hypothetical protein